MPPKAKKSKKELEEEKSMLFNHFAFKLLTIHGNRETRGRKAYPGGT
jgi:hypothetical protein